MIYEINIKDVYNLVQTGVTFIVNSADGCRALISSSTTPNGINIINVYEEISLVNLMNSPDWKQPCIDC